MLVRVSIAIVLVSSLGVDAHQGYSSINIPLLLFEEITETKVNIQFQYKQFEFFFYLPRIPSNEVDKFN